MEREKGGWGDRENSNTVTVSFLFTYETTLHNKKGTDKREVHFDASFPAANFSYSYSPMIPILFLVLLIGVQITKVPVN